MNRSIVLLILSLGFCLPAAQAGVDADWQTAVTAYNEGNFAAAAEAFLQIEAAGLESAELYYNIGNCAFREGDIAQAILYWERALKLSPGEPDVKRNLDMAAGLLADPLPPEVKLPFWRWFDRLLDSLSLRSWALLLLSTAWLLALTLGWRIWRYNRFSKRLTPYLILLLLITGSLFYTRFHRDTHDYRAVIMVDKITVRSAPDSLAAELFDLHTGSRVELLESTRNWHRIRLPNGQGGWLPNESITKI